MHVRYALERLGIFSLHLEIPDSAWEDEATHECIKETIYSRHPEGVCLIGCALHRGTPDKGEGPAEGHSS